METKTRNQPSPAQSPLQSEIDKWSSEIHADGYAMSIGELVNLYRDGELELHPEFQRRYRWSLTQKSRLVESILIGIPLPSIFVYQRESDNHWEVIDGLQRLSTIFEFMGEFRDETGSNLPALRLEGTRYLPSLRGRVWEDKASPSSALTPSQRVILKRAKIDVKIVKPGSTEAGKYELFYRLNRFGSVATDQEVRNCLLLMANKPFFDTLKRMAAGDDFIKCAALSDRQLDEQYDVELALRFVTFADYVDDIRFNDLDEFLTDRMLSMASDKHFSPTRYEKAFTRVFELLAQSGLEDDAFRRYDVDRDRHFGGSLISAFEVIALGLGYQILTNPKWSPPKALAKTVRKIWQSTEFKSAGGSGVAASTRLPKTIPLGRKLMK